MKFRAIEKQKTLFPIPSMCRWLEVSRSGYYAWKSRSPCQREKDDIRLCAEIRAYHKSSRGTYGSPRLHKDMQESGHKIGRNRIIRLMRQEKLCGRRKRKFVHTTDSNHDFPIAENLLDREFTQEEPNKAWVGDITYIHTFEGWVYLAALVDLFSRKVVGWSLDANVSTSLPLAALKMACLYRRPKAGLIHHTDRGSQYASKAYRKELKKKGIICSMSRRADCWDNAVGESFFARLKDDLIYRKSWTSRAELIGAVNDYIENFYNSYRRHSSANYLSPNDFEMHRHSELFEA